MVKKLLSEQVISELKAEREKKKWSVYKLSQECSIDQTALGRLERGEREPQFESVVKIANALDVKLSDILRKLGH